MRVLIITTLFLICAPLSAVLEVTPVTASGAIRVPYTYTGNGNGFFMGAFDVGSSNGRGLVLNGITLSASGSGDDSTAFSEVGLFVDTNSNGAYDPSIDSRYGAAYAAYPTDNGSLTFDESTPISGTSPLRFLIVVKLNGAVLPYETEDFYVSVSSLSGTGGSPLGVPTGPIARVKPVSGPTPLTLEYNVTGSSPPYSYVFRLVLDNHNGSWAAGQGWNGPKFGLAAFDAAGTIPFAGWATNAASYPIGPFNSTGWGSLTIPTVPPFSGPGLASGWWTPAFVGDELTWWGTVGVFLNEGEMSWHSWIAGGISDPGSVTLEIANRVGDYLRVNVVSGAAVDVGPTDTGGGNGFAIGAFDVISHTNAATLSGITLGASGTGDDSTAFSSVRLFVDSNGNGAYDPGVDTQFGQNYSAYPADDGSLTFNDSLNFNPDETKRLLVVAMLNGSTLATYGQTFNSTVTAISATGNMHSGLPTAVMPGIHISAPTLTVTASGSPQSVLPDAQGPGGIGVQATEFSISNNTVGTANLDSITVAAAGSMFDHTDFSSVALYEDTNLNSGYDAADTLYASAAAAFPSDDGSLTFAQATTFAPGQSRRFFLVVKLDLAQTGDDFWSRVTTLGVSGGTEVAGAPGTLIHGLTILPGVPQIAVSRGAGVPNGGTDTLPAATPGVNQQVTYTISNPGSASLDLTGTPLVQVTAGANINSVTATVLPAATVGAKATTTFTISYTAASPGVFDFTVSIASNDPVNNPYTWTATGTASSPPGGSGDGGGGDDGGCSTGERSDAGWLLAGLGLILLRLAARRRPTLSPTCIALPLGLR